MPTKAELEKEIKKLHEDKLELVTRNLRLATKVKELEDKLKDSYFEERKQAYIKEMVKKEKELDKIYNDSYSNAYKTKIKKLKNEIKSVQKLNDELKKQLKQKSVQKLNVEHNKRNAGRKSKLSLVQKETIIQRHYDGISMRTLAEEYNVSKSTIFNVINRKNVHKLNIEHE